MKLETQREIIYFNKDKSYRSYQAYDSKNKTITVKPNFDGYIRFDYDKNCYDIQVEMGSVATSYEPYITKKIHTKNDNGVYEEFYNEEEHKHTTILFKGSTTDVTISLMDDYKNYEEIEVVTYLQGAHNTHKCHTDYSTINLTDIQSSGEKWQQIRIGRGTFSGKTLTIDKVIGININMENYTFQSYSPNLEVKKVVGINKKNK